MMRLKIYAFVFLMCFAGTVHAQKFLMDMVDTSTEIGKSMLSIYQNFGAIKFSGYIQPQFQYAEMKGDKGFAGGDFAPNSDNRFMLRRSRIRVDYSYTNKRNELATYFVFQFDVTERGAVVRDVWGRVFENKLHMFSATMGLMARPFGYEVNLASSDRETPERGRMSQILMKAERDLGVALNFEPRGYKSGFLRHIKADLGVYNGPGLTGTTDYDSYKDFIGRVYTKPVKIKPIHLEITGGASILYGAVGSQSPWMYETKNTANGYAQVGDSATAHNGEGMARHYYGADLQLRFPSKKWTTELRGEYIAGMQTGVATSSETPGAYPVTATNVPLPLYVRQFNGAYFYLIQNIAGKKNQVVLKYDWYDPNTKVAGNTVSSSNGFTGADVRYNTFGIGYVYYANPHVKLMLYYDMITNENTKVAGYASDVKDNVLTCRVQYRF